MAKVDNLLPAHTGSDKLSLCRAERSARLSLGAPAHRAIVHRDDIARHSNYAADPDTLPSVRVSSIVAVHPT
eukprot:3172810-Rhodomonas_salina.1